MGPAAWLDYQLDYQQIGDSKLDLQLRRFDTLPMHNRDLLGFNGGPNRRYVTDELVAATLMRALYSERQLYEVMVGFWSDHFSLYHFKSNMTAYKTVDDREVIRAHALGTFGDLLRASAHSPAMLYYLDNVLNEKSQPNENYAREIMELHTLGVEGGYSETDIQEVARCFTGWSINDRGLFEFLPDWHDEGEKTVLGQTIPAGGGKSDGDRVLNILLAHPSTPRYVGGKLLRRLVADEPSPAMLDDVVSTWEGTGGDIRAIVRTVFNHAEFPAAPAKLKRPFELLVSLLRATYARYDGREDVTYILDRLGHRPFAWPTPDGYPDTAAEWTGNLLGRWNLCLDVMNGAIPGLQTDLDALAEAGNLGPLGDNYSEEALRFFGRLFLSRELKPEELGPLATHWQTTGNAGEVIALLAASPAFQWR
jgi:hypothetical protein